MPGFDSTYKQNKIQSPSEKALLTQNSIDTLFSTEDHHGYSKPFEELQAKADNSRSTNQVSQLQSKANQFTDRQSPNNFQPVQRVVDDAFIQSQLGDAFSDKEGEVDPEHQSFREEDTEQRLKDPKMIDCHLDEISTEGATWDFKHWMIEGEMPPTYGYGFPIREYFKNLSPGDRNNFVETAKTMRSATMITKTIEGFKPDIKGISAPQQEAYVKAQTFQEKGKSAENVQFADETMKMLFSLEPTEFQTAFGVVKNLIKSSANEGKLVAMGNQIWQIVAESRSLGEGEKEQWKEKSHRVGEGFMSLGREFQTKNKNQELSNAEYNGLKINLGHIARAWGNATAALGADPWGNTLTNSVSSVVRDYEEHDGAAFVEQKKREAISNGGTAWSDMDISESMWDKGANFDRYRGTKVHILAPQDSGADIANPKDHDSGNLRVTHQELQLGNNWDASKKNADGAFEANISKKKALDYQRDKVPGEWPKNWKPGDKMESKHKLADGSRITAYGAQRGGKFEDQLSETLKKRG